MDDELLPVGTCVQVTPHPATGERPYRAKVAGYDLHHTKYRLTLQLWPGQFTASGGWWAFPSEVKPINEGG